MKRKLRPAIGCAVSVAAISMFSSMAALAASDAEIEDAKWSFTAVANVTTQVNIRAGASTDTAVVGYLPKAGIAEVIERGTEWTHVISGGVEGYIKDEFLAYGEEAKRLAGVYGMPGVETYWDGVVLFAKPDCCAKVVETAETGSEYTILDKEGAWYQVQLDEETIAYVPAEDVKKTTILDEAIPVEGADQADSTTYTASTWQPEYAADTSGSGQSDSTSGSAAAQTDTSSAQGGSSSDSTTAQDSASAGGAAQNDSTATQSGSVSEETVTTASSSDVSLLAALIYCEAGNQSREGKVAVGAVVMNRIASSSYPGSIREVIYQSGQFSPAGSGWLDQVLSGGAPSDCYEAAQAALNGENPVPGALYFNTSAGRGTKIGAHWFY